MDGWMVDWMDGWIDGWTNEWVGVRTSTNTTGVNDQNNTMIKFLHKQTNNNKTHTR